MSSQKIDSSSQNKIRLPIDNDPSIHSKNIISRNDNPNKFFLKRSSIISKKSKTSKKSNDQLKNDISISKEFISNESNSNEIESIKSIKNNKKEEDINNNENKNNKDNNDEYNKKSSSISNNFTYKKKKKYKLFCCM